MFANVGNDAVSMQIVFGISMKDFGNSKQNSDNFVTLITIIQIKIQIF